MPFTKARLFVAAALIATPMFASLPSAAAATSNEGLSFGRIYYDSPGADKGSNTSLNNEWVTIRNNGKKTVALKGWTVRDRSKHTYTIERGSLGPGKTTRIHTGKGKNNSAHRYWGKTWYVWNNSGDTATLTSPSGKRADVCSWGNSSASYTNC